MDDARLAGDRGRMSFWDLLQAYRDETGASEAWVMRRAGLNKGAFTAWRARGIPALPDHDQLVALSDVLRVDYTVLLEAVLRDTNYLPEQVARQQAEFAATYKDAFWQQVKEVADEAMAAAGGSQIGASRRLLDGSAPSHVRAKARALVFGRIPPDAPDWLSEQVSEADDTLPAAAKEGQLEEPGE